MTINENNFIDRFTPKTPKQVQKEISLKERKQKQLEQLNYLEAMKPLTLLKEDLKNATDRFFNLHPETQFKKTVELDQPIEKKALLEQLQVADPLVVIDGKITIDPSKLEEMITSQAAVLAQKAFEKFNSANMANSNIGGGGGVGIKLKDYQGNITSVLKSVNDLIITGDGVTVTQRGKNVEINIPGVSVQAGDPTIDFARESTALSIMQSLYTINQTVDSLEQLTLPSEYSEGIGGSTGSWTAI
jgi:hypothetical protein